jgi:predicted NBD/HSP70 family sugar kinase
VARDREVGEVTGATVTAILEALLTRGPSTRANLTADTGLSRPTVSRTLALLLRAGAVEQVKDVNHGGRGRPPHLVRLSSRRADTLGVELGRGHIAFAMTDIAGSVVLAAACDTKPASSLVERANEALDLLLARARDARIDLTKIRSVVVGTPGPRYHNPGSRSGIDVSLARLSRERALVANVFTAALKAPVAVGNNTRYSALGEMSRRRAAGLGVDDLVYLRVDEGIGGGVVSGGELQAGAWDAAGEMGHISVDADGPACFCGGRGCLELVAALPAVLRAAAARDLDDLRDRATWDPAAMAAIVGAASATGRVVAGVLAVVNPSVLVIGGSVASLPGFLERVETVTRAVAPQWATLGLLVEAAATDHLLGAIGAAAAGYGPLGGAVPLVAQEVAVAGDVRSGPRGASTASNGRASLPFRT